MTKFHTPDCHNAKSDRCRCWCEGAYHGLGSDAMPDKYKGKAFKKAKELEPDKPIIQGAPVS